MELTVVLAQKILSLAIYIVLGFFAVRGKALTYADSKALSTFVLCFLTPCAMLDAYRYTFSTGKPLGMGVSFAASMVVVAVFALLALALKKPLTAARAPGGHRVLPRRHDGPGIHVHDRHDPRQRRSQIYLLQRPRLAHHIRAADRLCHGGDFGAVRQCG